VPTLIGSEPQRHAGNCGQPLPTSHRPSLLVITWALAWMSTRAALALPRLYSMLASWMHLQVRAIRLVAEQITWSCRSRDHEVNWAQRNIETQQRKVNSPCVQSENIAGSRKPGQRDRDCLVRNCREHLSNAIRERSSDRPHASRPSTAVGQPLPKDQHSNPIARGGQRAAPAASFSRLNPNRPGPRLILLAAGLCRAASD